MGGCRGEGAAPPPQCVPRKKLPVVRDAGIVAPRLVPPRRGRLYGVAPQAAEAGWSGAIYEEISEERTFQHGFGAVSAKRVPARHNAMRLQLLLAGKFAWSYSNQLPIRHQSFCLKADGAALTALHPIELHLSANDRLLHLFVIYGRMQDLRHRPSQ